MTIEDMVTREYALEQLARGLWNHATTIDGIRRNARQFPDKIALRDSQRSVTFAELDALTDKVAMSLLQLGLTKNDIIVVQLPNVVNHLAVLWGAQKIGVVRAYVMMTLRAADMRYVLSFTEAKAVFVPGKFRNFDYAGMIDQIRGGLPHLEHVVVVGDDAPAGMLSLDNLVDEASRHPLSPEQMERLRPDPWAIIQINTTTGTTGFPKFTLWRETSPYGRTIGERAAMRPDDVCLAIAPINGGGAAPCKYAATINGCTVVLQEGFVAEEALELIQRHRVNILCGVPAQVVKMLDVPHFDKYDLSSLRVFHYAGAALAPEVGRELMARTGCRIAHQYGMTDAGMLTFSSIFDDPEESLYSVGRPAPGVELRMLDDSQREVPFGEVGEIAARGPNVRAGGGYYKDPETNARALTPDGWYLTGDLGIQRANGMVSIVGRKKEIIIRGGQNISPREVEEMLLTHPKVSDVAVIAMPDRVMGEKACAYVVPAGGQQLSFDEMVAFLKEKSIAMYKLPERLELIQALPMAGDGQKVDRVALRRDVEQKLRDEEESPARPA